MLRHLGNPEGKRAPVQVSALYRGLLVDESLVLSQSRARIIRNNGESKVLRRCRGVPSQPRRSSISRAGQRNGLPHRSGRVFHYGWVKDPKMMLAKVKEQIAVYHGATPPPPQQAALYMQDAFQYEDYAVLKEFAGRHPSVMQARIRATRRWGPRRNRWLNLQFYREVLRRGFRG